MKWCVCYYVNKYFWRHTHAEKLLLLLTDVNRQKVLILRLRCRGKLLLLLCIIYQFNFLHFLDCIFLGFVLCKVPILDMSSDICRWPANTAHSGMEMCVLYFWSTCSADAKEIVFNIRYLVFVQYNNLTVNAVTRSFSYLLYISRNVIG